MLSVVSDIEELEALRGEWSDLWSRDPRATPFQSPEWLLSWWHHLFEGGQLWTVIQRQNGILVSLLPMFRYGQERERLAFIGTGVTDYLDIVGAPIEDIPGDWQLANLEEIRPASSLLNLGVPEHCSVCPVVALPATMENLIQRIDPKLAIDIHRSSNRLHRAGKVRMERTTNLSALFDLHRARWEDRNERGMLAEQQLQAFHSEVASGFETLGLLRLYRLTLEDRTIAVIYAFTHRERSYAYLSGFDPALSKLSPGTVLLAYVIEEAINEGGSEFDFLRNAEAYKYKWAAQDQPTYKIHIAKQEPDRASPD